MNRYDTSQFGAEPKHFDLSIVLGVELDDLMVTLSNFEKINTVQKRRLTSVVQQAISELTQCKSDHKAILHYLRALQKNLDTDGTIMKMDVHMIEAQINILDKCRTR